MIVHRQIARILFVIVVSLGAVSAASAQSDEYEIQQACAELHGAVVLAEDGTYLGRIDEDWHGDSIFADWGEFGSDWSAKSIWTDWAEYGAPWSDQSPWSDWSSTPPRLVKNGLIIGYLSGDESLGVHPAAIASACYGIDDYWEMVPD